MPTLMRRLLPLLVVTLAACSRGDSDARTRAFAHESGARRTGPAFDPTHPESSLALSAEDVARGLGSFDWTAAVEWSVEKGGADATRVRTVEHHTVRQLADGTFEVKAELDPGLGPGSTTGKQLVFVDGMTYARALPAAYRERPTDHGRDARRFRDESFGLARSVAALYGPALRIAEAGGATVLGRAARRYELSLAPVATPATPAPADPKVDVDTARRRAFLDGRVPVALEGELLADADTGAPLRVRISGAFTTRADPGVRTTVELLAQAKALGADVRAVAAPKNPLPDERKPAGPSTALEAAGLKKHGAEGDKAEPGDEPAE
jgi:hypothetical protein